MLPYNNKKHELTHPTDTSTWLLLLQKESKLKKSYSEQKVAGCYHDTTEHTTYPEKTHRSLGGEGGSG